jgi:hypothetical protein
MSGIRCVPANPRLLALLLYILPVAVLPAEEPAPPALVAPAVQLPDGPGRSALEKTCLGCHPANRIVAQRRSSDEWQALVAKMIEQGAMGSDEELQSIIDYLALNYGAPPGP